MSSSSTTVPGADARGTALTAIERVDELDDETALQLVQEMRPVGVGIAVGGMGPILLGLWLLKLAADGAAVPAVALAAVFGVALASPFALLYGQRRAFLAACRSVGVSAPLAKKLYWRFVREDFRIDTRPRTTRDEVDHRIVRRLLRPG